MPSNELVFAAVRQWPLLVRSLGRSYASSTSTAEREDAAMVALERFQQALIAGNLRHPERSFAFMRKTAGRILERHIKHNGRTSQLDDLHSEPQADDEHTRFEQNATLGVILGALRSSDREIILMRHTLGHSFDEIAVIRGKSKATVQRQYERAMARARVIAGVRKPGGGERTSKRNFKKN